jgi:hypothetical protein
MLLNLSWLLQGFVRPTFDVEKFVPMGYSFIDSGYLVSVSGFGQESDLEDVDYCDYHDYADSDDSDCGLTDCDSEDGEEQRTNICMDLSAVPTLLLDVMFEVRGAITMHRSDSILCRLAIWKS